MVDLAIAGPPGAALARLASNAWAYPALEVLHIVGIALLVGSLVLFELRVWGLAAALPVPEFARLALGVSWLGFALAAASGLTMFATQAGALPLLAGALSGARAHHGWSGFDPERPLYLEGRAAKVRWANPHAEIELEVAPEPRLPADLKQRELPAQTAQVVGYTFAGERGDAVLRAEYVFVGGKAYGLRSSPA